MVTPTQPSRRLNTGRSSEYSDNARYGFSVPGNLTNTDNDKIALLPGQNDHVSRATAQVKTAPVGSAITIDVKLYLRSDGSVISTLGTITINDGAKTGDLGFADTAVDDLHAIGIEITNVGSGTPGATLSVIVQGR